jgi:choline-sulfatase
MNSIKFLQFAAISPIVLLGSACTNKQQAKKPNIIYIWTDQQTANMMSCAGNQWVKTPAMDYLAEHGVRFTRAYAPNPVSAAARLSMITGRFPGYFKDSNGNQVRENGGAAGLKEIPDEVRTSNLATLVQKAGYDIVFGGKSHIPEPLDPKNIGFNVITRDERDELASKTAEFIKSEHDKPYFMVVSLINPHDICYMAIRDFAQTKSDSAILKYGGKETATLDLALKIPENISEETFFAEYCPPVPPNYDFQEDEPKAIDWFVKQRPFKKYARDNYSDKDWRRHRWAYCRLTEMVDKQLQTILDALKESGQLENTLIIFSSDHGDMDASHRLEHKTVLYEESANIPFIVMWQGQLPAGKVDSVHLVSNGLDLLPTVTDYAGLKGQTDERGRSLRPLFEEKNPEWRQSLGIECEIGRGVVSADKYKFIQWDIVGIEERLHDLNKDPYEKTHFTNKPEYADKLASLKKEFAYWFPSL